MAKIPINIITASYLDPTQFKKYLYIWAYLGFLQTIQYTQFLWVKSKSRKWNDQLMNWIKTLNESPIDPNYAFQWRSFKEENLPQSIDFMLNEFGKRYLVEGEKRRGKKNSIEWIPPLVRMGASFVDTVNVVQDRKNVLSIDGKKYSLSEVKQKVPEYLLNDKENSPMQVGREDWIKRLKSVEMCDDKYKRKDIETEVSTILRDVNKKEGMLKDLLNLNFFEWTSISKPMWKSNFIIKPKNVKEIRDLAVQEKDSIEFHSVFDEEPEQPYEFDSYLFEEFLNEVDPFVQYQNKTLGPLERTRYILGDIERDRERLVYESIKAVTNENDSK